MQQTIIRLLLLCMVSPLVGQQTLYQHFTVEDGLPSLTVHQIQQDRLGYLWLATDKGISKFDGYQFVNFTIKDGLPSNYIQEIFIDSQNRVWLNSQGNRIAFLKNDDIHIVQTSEKKLNLRARGLHEYKDTVWLDTEQGLFFYVEEKLFPFALNNENWELAGIDAKGQKLFYDEDGRIYPNGNTSNSFILPIDSTETLDSRVYLWRERLLFETESQLYFFKDSLMPIQLSSGLSIEEQRPPHLVSRRDIRLFTPKNELKKVYTHQANFRLQGAFQDREGNWWFNTFDDGVYLLTANAQLAKTFNVTNGLEDPLISAVTKDEWGNIFIGTLNGDLYLLPIGENQLYLIPIANARKIQSMTIDENHLYIGSQQGLHILNRSNFEFAMFGFGITSDMFSASCNPPNCLIEKQSDNYFISGGLRNITEIVYHEKQLFVATKSGLWALQLDRPDAYKVTKISEEAAQTLLLRNNQLWAGTSDGILTFQLDGSNPTPIPNFAYPVRTFSSKNEDVWIGTDGFGVFHLTENKTQIIAGTDRDIVEKITIDEQGFVWCATNNGIKKITHTGTSYSVRLYNVIDGLPTQETKTLLSDLQNIYVGTNRGFTIMDKILLSSNKVVPPIYIKKVTVNNQNLGIKPTFRLTHSQNNISVEYVSISIKSNKAITYVHKMEGIDKNWQTAQKTTLDYRGLSPNKYTLRIKAIDVEGKESDERSIVFFIKPPFWQTLWFRTAFILCVAGLVTVFVRWRIRNIQQQEKEKAALQLKVAEEKAEIERINNELAKSKLETLQAQMNPHFAYNALTSIQKFILKKDNKTANKYLVKFARLMRQFLEASKETYIPLGKEIELLKLYIEMEQLRFKDKFEVVYEIANDVNLAQIPIPSMLLQVFVENAINHGLVYKEGEGVLKFIVRKEGEQVLCIVEDDGIGRKKAQEIKAQSVGAYKGLGMKISKERVKYLNMMENIKINVVIEDDILKHQPGGTRVNVYISQ